MISRGRLGALIALSTLGTVAATSGAEMKPAPVEPEPEIDPRQRSGKGQRNEAKVRRYGSSPKLHHATLGDARTDNDAARITAAEEKRARKAAKRNREHDPKVETKPVINPPNPSASEVTK